MYKRQPNREIIRKIHRQASFSRKDIRKAIDYEAKKEIGDKAFILKNRSIYNTKRNGDIVLKDESEIGCSVSFDTPRKLINENKEDVYKRQPKYSSHLLFKYVLVEVLLKDIVFSLASSDCFSLDIFITLSSI